MEFIFATNNDHKIKEVKDLLPPSYKIITLREAGIFEEIDEPFHTFEENALAKAQYIYNKTGKNCFAEDSGICVSSLNGDPGVFSARFAGEPRSDERNNELLLQKLEGSKEREAYYNSTIALILNGEEHIFSGKCQGKISEESRGNNGFGYDPLFIPDGYSNTFGELPENVKQQLSHRKESIALLVNFLKNQS